MDLKGDQRCGVCKRRGVEVCVVSSDYVARLRRWLGTRDGEEPSKSACVACRGAKSKCVLPGASEQERESWSAGTKGKGKKKSAATVEDSEGEEPEGLAGVEATMLQMDASLHMVQEAVETLQDRMIDADRGVVDLKKDLDMCKQRLFTMTKVQRQHGDILEVLLSVVDDAFQHKKQALETKWKKEGITEEQIQRDLFIEFERMKKRWEMEEMETETQAEAEAATEEGGEGEEQRAEDSEDGSGGDSELGATEDEEEGQGTMSVDE